ncbi:hypothetical protein RHECNPAF_74008 [Rhizobium etli CNPAF512]|nr:hypothetical protein RHECNPAF_74008 [Rhizobium etli CNPAF512]
MLRFIPGSIVSASCWLASMPSDIGRRPKGVVTYPLSIAFTFVQAKENDPPIWCLRRLTVIRGNAILDVLKI